MWPRETTARSGDIVGGIGSPLAKPMSSGFAAESTVVCVAAKNSKSLAVHVKQKPLRYKMTARCI